MENDENKPNLFMPGFAIENKYKDIYDFFIHNLVINKKVLNGINIEFEEEEREGYLTDFIHTITLSEEEGKYDMLPCQNHESQKVCRTQCNLVSRENRFCFIDGGNKIKDRVECPYRAVHIPFLVYILDCLISNSNSDKIKTWETDVRKNKNLKRLNIRYEDEGIDYIIILEINNSHEKPFYRFITAFPIVLKSYRHRYDGEYKKFLRKK